VDRRNFLKTVGASVGISVLPLNLILTKYVSAKCPDDRWTDYVFAPGAGSPNVKSASDWEGLAGVYFERRPNTRLLAGGQPSVEAFVDTLLTPARDACVTLPARDLFIVSHGTPDGWMAIRMDSTHPNSIRGAIIESVEFGDLEDMAREKQQRNAQGDRGSIEIPHKAVSPRPTGGAKARLRLVACQVGEAVTFVDKLKEVIGDEVALRVPKFRDFFVTDGFSGSVEYFGYVFVVSSLTDLPDRAAVKKAFIDAREKLFNGNPVPDSEWEKWLPKGDIQKTGTRVPSFSIVVLNPKIEGLDKRRLEVPDGYKADVDIFGPEPFASATEADAASETTRRSFVESKLSTDTRFKGAFPLHQRLGFDTLALFTAAYDWWPRGFGAPWEKKEDAKRGKDIKEWRGYRNRYVLIVPITNADGFLFYNYVGSNGQSLHQGLENEDALFITR